ncbi:hypothetical protein ANCCAN_26930 [Ancylostoma caninum]|uniref:Uncharacterized protein n=1 Tax=Ancylostoma caninum TaxID=29170 RepID=A0A368FAX6_ANCCA|nr:hypothetical protein ANCCAN_26930 [Ancylostoma caninum]
MYWINGVQNTLEHTPESRILCTILIKTTNGK